MTTKVKPEDWPNHGNPLNDDEALTIARLILDGKPKSFVEGAMRLALYIVELNNQAEEFDKLLSEGARDTLPEVELLSAGRNSL